MKRKFQTTLQAIQPNSVPIQQPLLLSPNGNVLQTIATPGTAVNVDAVLNDISWCSSFNVYYTDTEIGVTRYGYTAAVIAKKIVQDVISDSVYTCTPASDKH